MVTKTISLDEEAYERLKAHKRAMHLYRWILGEQIGCGPLRDQPR
jgi:hypothetical protein